MMSSVRTIYSPCGLTLLLLVLGPSKPLWFQSQAAATGSAFAEEALAFDAQDYYEDHEAMSDSERSTGAGRRLGDITARINNGRWQEFRTRNSVGSGAFPCTNLCSTSSLSQKLGASNTSPWTFHSDCSLQLTVMQALGAGDTVWEVFDNGVSQGSTLAGQVGDGCQEDPAECLTETDTGMGQFYLAEGSHSIQIKVVSQTNSLDGGWFKIDDLVCPAPSSSPSHHPSAHPSRRPSAQPSRRPSAAPSVSAHPSAHPSSKPSEAPSVSSAPTPTCLGRSQSCKLKPSATPCCAKYICRRQSSSGSSRACLPCAAANQRCFEPSDCCAGKVCRSASGGSGKKCLDCIKNGQTCATNSDCCSKNCVTKSSGKKQCKKK